jgi:biofilm PGA synthesis N-glycosyltransferase PgaC
MLLNVTCLIQFGVSLAIDARYEYLTGGHRTLLLLDDLVSGGYWLINVGTTITGSIKAIRKKRGQRAIWATLNRGLREK